MIRPLLLLLAAAALSGCGIRGTLERPPPIWGDPEQARSDGQAEAIDEAREDEDEDRGIGSELDPRSSPAQ